MPALLTLASWLLSLAAPIAKQVMLSLGFGLVTYTGINAGYQLMVDSLRTQYAMIPPDMLVYVKMSGAVEAMGLILAALAFKITLTQTSRLMKI